MDHLSYSAIEEYLSCSRRYRYRYVDSVPSAGPSPALIFGRAFHQAIEVKLRDNHKAKILPELWKQTWTNVLEEEGSRQIQWGVETPDNLYETGKRMFSAPGVQKALAEVIPMPDMIEWRFELKVPGVPVPVVGFLDVVTASGLPIDFKTASKRWPPSRADSSLQPTIYLAALNAYDASFRGWKFRYMIFTKGAKPAVQILDTQRDVSHVIRFYNVARHVWRGIQQGVFIPYASESWKCTENYCGYWDRCQGGVLE